jgi:hypothetical protein
VHCVDISGMNEKEIKEKIHTISHNIGENEIFFCSDENISVQLENLPEGQVLTIKIDTNNNSPDVEELIKKISLLRDYYEDLTIKIIDINDTVNPDILPEDTIVKK